VGSGGHVASRIPTSSESALSQDGAASEQQETRMSISAVNGSSVHALFHQRRVDFKALAQAVEAGDTTASQAALQNYQQDAQAIAADAAPSDSGGAGDFATQIKTDLSNLTAAVQAGNMTDAQTALAAYEQDKDSLRDAGSAQVSDASSAFAQNLTSLLQSVQSGDAEGIKASGTALAKDVQSLSQSEGSHGVHHHHHHHASPPSGATDAAGETSLVDNPGDQSAGGAQSTGATSDNDPTSAALAQFVKDFTETLEEFAQAQQKTV
jgi:hypothetical protein